MDGKGSGLSNSTIEIIDAFTISLASLSTIDCIIALVVLIYFKLYHSFIYRLVLYSFVSLIILSLSTTAMTISLDKILQKNGNSIIQVISMLFYGTSLSATILLITILLAYVYVF